MEIINIIVLYFLPSVFISTLLEYMLQYICHFFNCSNKLLVIYNFFFPGAHTIVWLRIQDLSRGATPEIRAQVTRRSSLIQVGLVVLGSHLCGTKIFLVP